ncbi:MAG: hypothetical protein LBH51_08895 [Treponema sp.]|jgi:hypothetical protein|nr:hypothetical protein [Treponema sp.]
MTRQKIPLLPLVLLILRSLPPVYGRDLPTAAIEDDSGLRLSIRDSWLLDAPDRVLARPSALRVLPGGGQVQIRTETIPGEFAVILARELTGPQGQSMGSFPGWAQGSWVYARRRDNGAPLRIRVFLRSDSRTYIQFRPLGEDRSLMDMILYDACLAWSLPVPLPFNRLLTMPMETVYAALGEKFNRRYFDPDPDNYQDLRLFVSRLRSRLPELSYRDDGAFDSQGRYVFIETQEPQDDPPGLNCSGFAKWVVDGILRPRTGRRLDIGPLKQPFGSRGSSFTDVWEDLRDPFFGLDWTRNLASQAWTILRSPSYAGLEDIEVRDIPFSQLILRGQNAVRAPAPGPALKNYPGKLENSGFDIEGLRPILYTLAVDEPGRLYLASINTEMGAPTTADNLRGLPRIRQHFHIAVLAPFFDEYGGFQVAVFESAVETRFARFLARYPGCQVNLVRLPVEGPFDP